MDAPIPDDVAPVVDVTDTSPRADATRLLAIAEVLARYRRAHELTIPAEYAGAIEETVEILRQVAARLDRRGLDDA